MTFLWKVVQNLIPVIWRSATYVSSPGNFGLVSTGGALERLNGAWATQGWSNFIMQSLAPNADLHRCRAGT